MGIYTGSAYILSQTEFMKWRADSGYSTKTTTRGDSLVPYKHIIFALTALSVKGDQHWTHLK